MLKKLLAVYAIIGVVSPSVAATTPNNIILPQVPKNGSVQFLQGTDSAGTYKTIYTAGTNGSKCFALWATTNDGTTAHLVTTQQVNSTIKYGGVAVTIGGTGANAGFANGVPSVNFMLQSIWPGLPLDSNGNPYIILNSGDTLQATFATALTSSTVINMVAECIDF